MGDLSNGRADIYSSVINYILNKPFLGYGMNSSPFISSDMIRYPHNFILQLLLDGGIICAIIPIFISIYSIYSLVIKFPKREHTIFLIFLESISIPYAFLSGNIWQIINFWLLISWSTANIVDLQENTRLIKKKIYTVIKKNIGKRGCKV